MRQAIEIKPEWLVEIAPHYYKLNDVEDAGSQKLPKGKGRAVMDKFWFQTSGIYVCSAMLLSDDWRAGL